MIVCRSRLGLGTPRDSAAPPRRASVPRVPAVFTEEGGGPAEEQQQQQEQQAGRGGEIGSRNTNSGQSSARPAPRLSDKPGFTDWGEVKTLYRALTALLNSIMNLKGIKKSKPLEEHYSAAACLYDRRSGGGRRKPGEASR